MTVIQAEDTLDSWSPHFSSLWPHHCVCEPMCVCMSLCVCARAYVCVHESMWVCMSLCVCAWVYVCVHESICVCMNLCVCVWVCAWACACTCACECTHSHPCFLCLAHMAEILNAPPPTHEERRPYDPKHHEFFPMKATYVQLRYLRSSSSKTHYVLLLSFWNRSELTNWL